MKAVLVLNIAIKNLTVRPKEMLFVTLFLCVFTCDSVVIWLRLSGVAFITATCYRYQGQ